MVDYAADYASALAGFDANRSGDFDSATEVESAIEAGEGAPAPDEDDIPAPDVDAPR